MEIERALKLSAALADAGWAHDVAVRNGEDRIDVRVTVPMPRLYQGGISAAIAELEAIGEKHDLTLHTSFMQEGLTFSTKSEAAELVLRLHA